MLEELHPRLIPAAPPATARGARPAGRPVAFSSTKPSASRSLAIMTLSLARLAPALALLVVPALLADSALADRVVTEDGRVLRPKKARKEGDGYRLIFEHGEIVLPDDQGIKAVEIEGDMSDYVPKNEDEKKKLEEGYIRYDGKWWSKPAYEAQLAKEHEESRERADYLAQHSNWHDCWVEETRHFIIKTNTSPELLEYYGKLLEAYYDLMDDRVGIDPTLSYRRKKMTVNIYKSQGEFYEYSAAGVGPGVLGYFWSYDDTLNFYHDYQEPSLSDWVALHECTHLLTFLIEQQYVPQIWLNEAVADYFGSAEITVDGKGRIEIEPGQLQTDRVLTVQNAIKEGNDIALKDLFFIDRNSFHGFEYAHAWSFVYFLNEYDGGEYRKGFQKFFRDLYTLRKGIEYEIVNAGGLTGTGKQVKPEDIRDLLLEKIRVKDLDELEEQWKEFVAAIPIESVAARLKRGIRACRMGKFDEAAPDLDAAIEGGTTDPRAYAYRGQARAFTGNRSGARADLEKAIELDPLNAAYRYQLSVLMTGGASTYSGGGGFSVSFDSEGEKIEDPEAKAMAGLAHELAPDNDFFRSWYQRFE